VLRACRRYVQNPADAEDLAQEVLLKAAQAWPGFASRCARTTWLHQVARNHCVNHHRASRRYESMLDLYAAGLPEPAYEGLGENAPNPTDLLWDRLLEGMEGGDLRLAQLRFGRG